MPRTARVAPGGMVFHVLNRGVGRMRLFNKDRDYEAFEEVIEKTLRSCPMRICCYLLMPNHWHFVLWPEKDGELAAFMQKLSVTHVRNWQENRRRVGMGHVYQGRTGKGILFFVCVLGTFFYGLYLGGGKVVYAATNWEQQYRYSETCRLWSSSDCAARLPR